MTKFNITSGTVFTVQNQAHWAFGRQFECIGFDADKSGVIYAVCEDTNDKSTIKSSYIFYAAEFA